MKHMQTPSHTFIAVKLDTTGNVLRKPLDVVKKFNIVVTPAKEQRAMQKGDELMKNFIYYLNTGKYSLFPYEGVNYKIYCWTLHDTLIS